MHFHHRLIAARADKRITTRPSLSTVAAGVALALTVTACGSDTTSDPDLGAPTPTTAEIGSGTVDLAVADTVSNGDSGSVADDSDFTPDYTAEELEELIAAPEPTDSEVLDAPEPEPLEAGSPEAVIQEVQAELDDRQTATADSSEVLDRVQPLDDAPSGDVIGIREGRRINEAGEAHRLDEAAALACGHVEVALTSIDEGRTAEAVERLRASSTMAADTSVEALKPWTAILGDSAAELESNGPSGTDVSPLLAFLTTCTQGGYEL